MGSDSARTNEARQAEEVPFEEGAVLDERYRVVNVLGVGGMGIVYRTEHLGLKREVAVKVLRKGFVQHVSLRPRFEREARSMAAMSHPNIVSVMDYGVTDGSPYIVMDLLQGRTLRALMSHGPVPEQETLRIVRALLRGLGYAHARGLVHRDVKPSNVFLQSLDAQGEHVKLLDFGFAKIQADSDLTTGSMISEVDETFGTPAYMSPEQAMGDHLDHRADLYSVGIVLFEMLAAHKPFDGDVHEIVKAHLAAPVPPLEDYRPDVRVRPPLVELLRTALAKNPRDRFADADAMVAAIEALPRESLVPRDSAIDDVAETLVMRPQTEPPAPDQPEGRVRSLVIGAVLAAIALAGFAWVVSSGEPPEQATSEAPLEGELFAEGGSEVTAEPGSEAELADRAEAAEVLHLAAWEVHPRVPLLEAIRQELNEGRTPTERAVLQLRAYSRGNRADPRPHVLLARIFQSRNWWSDALARFSLAYEVDPRIAGDPMMRESLHQLADNPSAGRDARDVVELIYGPDGGD